MDVDLTKHEGRHVARHIVAGLLSSLPLLESLMRRRRRKFTPLDQSGRYCYSVWMRHLVSAKQNGLIDGSPHTVLELGPGSSLGTGLAALLSNTARLCALDGVQVADTSAMLRVLDELTGLFRDKKTIPDNNEFWEIFPLMETCSFPGDILGDDVLREALSPKRIARIRDSILSPASDGPVLYKAPWSDYGVVEEQSVDMILSQAVMEHVDDLPNAYQAMSYWLKPGGVVSHTIDFRSHGIGNEWDSHWSHSDLTWRLVRARRPYLINREPASVHLDLLKKHGFAIREQVRYRAESNLLSGAKLAPRFRNMSDDDLTTAVLFVQAQKA